MDFIKPAAPELPIQCSRRTEINIWGQPPSVSVSKPPRDSCTCKRISLTFRLFSQAGELHGSKSFSGILVPNSFLWIWILDSGTRKRLYVVAQSIYLGSGRGGFYTFLCLKGLIPHLLLSDKYYIRWWHISFLLLSWTPMYMRLRKKQERFSSTNLVIKGILMVWNNFQFLILLTEFGFKKKNPFIEMRTQSWQRWELRKLTL